MTHHSHKQESEITLKKWLGTLLSFLVVAFVTFLGSTLLHSWTTTDIIERLNKQDVINATISTSLIDIKDDLKEIKSSIKK